MVRAGRPSNAALSKNQSLALARQVRLETGKASKTPTLPPNPSPNDAKNEDADNESSGDEIQCTGWSGGVTHYVSSDEEPIFISDDDDDEEVVEELSGSELEEVIQRHREQLGGTTTTEESSPAPRQLEAEPNMLSIIMGQRTNQEWKKAESTRSLGYNGQSFRMKRHREKIARDKEVEYAKARKG